MREVDRAALEEAVAAHPVVMRGRTKRGGALAILFETDAGGQMAALATEQEAQDKDVLDDDDLATLQEVAASCLGGGA